jgi:hypothetical protein
MYFFQDLPAQHVGYHTNETGIALAQASQAGGCFKQPAKCIHTRCMHSLASVTYAAATHANHDCRMLVLHLRRPWRLVWARTWAVRSAGRSFGGLTAPFMRRCGSSSSSDGRSSGKYKAMAEHSDAAAAAMPEHVGFRGCGSDGSSSGSTGIDNSSCKHQGN